MTNNQQENASMHKKKEYLMNSIKSYTLLKKIGRTFEHVSDSDEVMIWTLDTWSRSLFSKPKVLVKETQNLSASKTPTQEGLVTFLMKSCR